MGRLVLLGGVPGSGKSTLARSLAGALEPAGAAFVPEDVIFEDPSLTDLAEAFRSRRFPTADDLLDGWARVLEALADAAWIVNDGSWVLLAEDLPWAQQSWDAIVDYTRRLASLSGPALTVLYLDGSIATATQRRRRRDGERRFAQTHAYLRRYPSLASWRSASDVELITAFGERIKRIYEAAGVPLTLVDSDGTPDQVLARALAALADPQPPLGSTTRRRLDA